MPHTPVEISPLLGADELCALWAEVLGAPDVTPDSDFFELGGDSVLLMSLLMRIEETYGIYLQPEDIFDAPNPRAFSALVESRRTGG